MQDRDFEGRLANVSGAILLGGASSRMGRDKAQLELDGVPFATALSIRLARIVADVMLIGGTPPAGAIGRPVADCAGPRSALRGLVSALEAARCERVIVLSTDVPLVAPALLLALTAWPEVDAVVPRAGGFTHPLCAIYRRDRVLEVAREVLASGDLRFSGVLASVDTRFLEGDALRVVDPGGRSLTNVNTPDEFAALSPADATPSLFA